MKIQALDWLVPLPPGGQWYGPSGGVDAAEQGQPSWAKARQAACKWGRRAASLRSGLLFLILDAGNSEQFGLFLLPSPPDLTSSRAGLTRRRRRKKAGAERAWDCGFKSPIGLFWASRTGRSGAAQVFGSWLGFSKSAWKQWGQRQQWRRRWGGCMWLDVFGENASPPPRITAPAASVLSFERVNPLPVRFPHWFSTRWLVMIGRVGVATPGRGCCFYPGGVRGARSSSG